MSTADWCPEPSDPQVKDPANVQSTIDCSHLCENGWQPLLITGFLRDFMIRQWSSATNLLAPEMQQYLWTSSAGSGILIESSLRFNPEAVEKRPAIIIKRNAFRNLPMGIKNESMGTGIAAYPNEKGAISDYATLFVGSHTLFCIHKTGASTEILAGEVMTQLVAFSPAIRQDFGLRQFSVAEVGDPQLLTTEAFENYAVPITVGWAYEYAWRLRLQSHPLQEVAIGTTVDTLVPGKVYSGP